MPDDDSQKLSVDPSKPGYFVAVAGLTGSELLIVCEKRKSDGTTPEGKIVKVHELKEDGSAKLKFATTTGADGKTTLVPLGLRFAVTLEDGHASVKVTVTLETAEQDDSGGLKPSLVFELARSPGSPNGFASVRRDVPLQGKP